MTRSLAAALSLVVCLLPVLALSSMASAATAPDVDGFVLTLQTAADGRAEELRSYELKAGAPVGHKVLYSSTDRIVSACMSPFGNRAAFVAPGGTIMVVDLAGGEAEELADDALWVQWPAGDGGRWIYFVDAGDKSTLRRVHADSGDLETVVTFDRTVEFGALSPNASPDTGWLVMPAGDSNAGVYPMSRGTGSTWSIPQWWQFSGSANQRLSVAPDSTVFSMLAPDGTVLVIGMPAFDNHPAAFRLDPMNFRNRPANWFRESDWQRSNIADPHYLKRAVRVDERLKMKRARFVHPVWAVNPPGWMALTQLNYGSDDREGKPVSSDILLWDAVEMAHHGIPEHISVTSNPAGVHERAVGFWQRLPAEYSLGFYNGKAPFTVTFDDSRLTEEMLWDFGDGSPRIKARNPTHTFKTAGRFKIVAEKEPWAKRLRTHMDEPGEGLYFGEAEIAEAAAPTATVQYVDDTHLLVEFDQRMQAKDAAVSLAGGIKVAKWALRDSGRRLAVELESPLKAADKLTLSGFTDLGQEPKSIDGAIDVRPPAWPTDPSKLVFWWEDAANFRATVTPAGEIRRNELFRDGPPSGFDKLGRMDLGVGGFRGNLLNLTALGAGNAGEIVLNNTFTFECTFQTEDLAQQEMRRPPRIISFSSHRPFVSLFQIAQQADRLLVEVKTSDNWLEDMGPPLDLKRHDPEKRKGAGARPYGHGPWVEVAQLKDTNSHHLVVTFKPGALIAYIDGKKVYETDRVVGDLDWGFGVLMFGSHHGLSGGSDQWDGRLEGVAFYSRVLEADEVQRNFEAYANKIRERAEKAATNEVTQ